MGRIWVRVSALAILATGTIAISNIVLSAPAFNADHRRANVFDQDIPQIGSDMYDRSRYLMQQAVSYIRADLIPYSGGDNTEIIVSVETVMDRGAQAVALMEESLSLNPGNAHGWVVMAWAQLYSGNDTGALDALQASWALAPHNYSLAPERLDLTLALFPPNMTDLPEINIDEITNVTINDDTRQGVQQDFQLTIEKYGVGLFGYFTQELQAAGFEVELPQR